MSDDGASGEPAPHDVLTRRQTRERTARAMARAGVTSERRRQELLDYVVSINSGLADAVVVPYVNRGIELDGLLRIANAALVRAARDFDPDQQCEFHLFAVHTIRRELKKRLREHGWTGRTPEHLAAPVGDG